MAESVATKLTPRQAQLLSYLLAYQEERGQPPTVRQMAQHLRSAVPMPWSRT